MNTMAIGILLVRFRLDDHAWTLFNAHTGKLVAQTARALPGQQQREGHLRRWDHKIAIHKYRWKRSKGIKSNRKRGTLRQAKKTVQGFLRGCPAADLILRIRYQLSIGQSRWSSNDPSSFDKLTSAVERLVRGLTTVCLLWVDYLEIIIPKILIPSLSQKTEEPNLKPKQFSCMSLRQPRQNPSARPWDVE